MLRIVLFIVTNLAVSVSLSLIAYLILASLGLSVSAGPSIGLFIYCLIFGMSGSFISLQLSRWMAKWMMGVQLIGPEGPHSWVYHKVVDLSKRAGLPAVPEVGIWPDSKVNAFATGPSQRRSLVAVSAGLLESMDPQQIEAVIAHEIAHIQNGDMVTMAILQGVANTFVEFFSRVLAWAASNSVDEKWSWLVGLATRIVSYIVLFLLAGLALCWFSRKREYRADAGAARLVGVDGMKSALSRLGQILEGGAEAELPEAVAAFGITSKKGGSWLALWSTHPPLVERIKALDRGVV
jgi:heat shock protein HtpX